MHPKKSFVYSIGASSQLDESEFRVDICIAFIEALCLSLPSLCAKKYLAFDETEAEAKFALTEGRFPKGFRYIASLGDKPHIKREIHKILLKKLI